MTPSLQRFESPRQFDARVAPSLRMTLAWTTGLVVLVGLVVSGCLILLTTILHRTTSNAAVSVESVRLAEEAQVDVLMVPRAVDGVVLGEIEADLRRKLVDMRRFVSTAEEAQIDAAAQAAVNAYLDGLRSKALSTPELDARQAAAYGALEALVGINVAQAKDALVEAGRWDDLADYIGVPAAVLLLALAAGLFVWLRRYVFGPAFSLAEVIQVFGNGDRSARAAEEGAEEFRAIARGFNDMASSLERQRERQLAFLAGVAHDLRNPLSALRLSSALISPDRPLPPEERVRQAFGRVQRQIERLERMVFDFLDAARVEAGNLDLQLERCDIRDVVRATVDLFEPTAPAHQLLVSAPLTEVPLVCDPARLEQVLNNLVSNAIKYSPGGGALQIGIRNDAEEVVISVRDEGLGIAADEMELVFEPFRRSKHSKDFIPGVGLGLFVARRIVEAHGGRITIESTLGKGSTFILHLPRRAHADGLSSSRALENSPS